MRKLIFFLFYSLGVILLVLFFLLLFLNKHFEVMGLTLFFWANMIMGLALLINFYSSKEKIRGYVWCQDIIGYFCLIQSTVERVPFNKFYFLDALLLLTCGALYFKYKCLIGRK